MPPGMPQLHCLGISNLSICAASRSCSKSLLPITPVAHASSKALRRKYRDPYALAQAKQRRLANIDKQNVLAESRKEARGDHVRGITTPFVESFDNASFAPTTNVGTQDTDATSSMNRPLNHYVKPSELEESLQHSFILTQPLINKIRDTSDPKIEQERIDKHAASHERAAAALSRIVSLSNGNQKDKTRVNIEKCIETFGRHNTDSYLQRPVSTNSIEKRQDVTPRAGPDTGSAEVQIAVLTAKIRVLANALEEKRGSKDKINKRNLRILVHKRQKLLAYLRRKERGNERWKNVTETLGLTEGTWKGEISL